MQVREALNAAMEEEMIKDETVYVMGEEVAQYNGAYKVNKFRFWSYFCVDVCRLPFRLLKDYLISLVKNVSSIPQSQKLVSLVWQLVQV